MTTATLIAAGVGVAATGAEIGYQASQTPPSAPSATTTAEQEAAAANASAQAQASALQKRRGLAATTLTSPMGATGSANVQKATLG